MEIYFMVCAGLSTAALIVAVGYLVQTLEQVRLTAAQARRTAEAVESLARHLDENVEAVGGITRKVYDVVDGVQSGWIQALKLGIGLFTSMRERSKAAAPESSQPPRE